MCGIVAITGPAAADRATKAIAALHHRGPDGEGLFVSRDRSVALAHARLAIVDAAGGAQPIANEDQSVVVVASGEIYDARALRADLERRGHRFATRSDSELLVHLYEEHGLGCVERVRGELAFVLWDERRHRLVAARDRFGIRPLVWARDGHGIAIASEAKALFAAGARAAWDSEAFFVAASVQYTPPDRTLFAGIRTLPPGSMLVAEGEAIEIRRYWDLDYPRLDAPARDVDLARDVREVRARLEDAIAVRASAEVPVAFHLSGGLDSTAVLALGARHTRGRARAFTLAFDDAAYDERTIARATASHVGADLVEIDASGEALANALPGAIAHGEGLAINAHIAAKWMLARAISSEGFKVALSGEGADEVFAGYAHLRRDLGVTGTASSNGVSVGTMLPSSDPTLSLDAVKRTLGFVPSFLEAKAAFGKRLHDLFAAPFAIETRDRDGLARMLEAFDGAELAGRAPAHVSLHLWSRTALATYILRTLGDAMDLAHAVEVRLPFLDHHVFEHARSIPLAHLVARGEDRVVEKHVLREAVRDAIPDAVYRREKHPLLAPPVATSVTGRARELTGDVLARCSAPFFDRSAVRALVDRVPRMTAPERVVTEPVLMTVLSACILHDSYGLG